jgi:hypothetical protein
MKKSLSILFILLTVVAINSCRKNDIQKATDNATSSVKQQSVVGKWTVTNMTVTITNKDSKATNTSKSSEPASAKQQWEFNADGNLYIQHGLSTATIPYQIVTAGKIILSYKNASDTLDVSTSPNKVILTESKILPNGKISNMILELGQN